MDAKKLQKFQKKRQLSKGVMSLGDLADFSSHSVENKSHTQIQKFREAKDKADEAAKMQQRMMEFRSRSGARHGLDAHSVPTTSLANASVDHSLALLQMQQLHKEEHIPDHYHHHHQQQHHHATSFLPHSTGRPAFLVLLPLHFSSPNVPGRDPAQRAKNQSKTAKSRFLGVDFCGKLCSSAVQALQLLSRGGSALRRPAAVVDHGLAP